MQLNKLKIYFFLLLNFICISSYAQKVNIFTEDSIQFIKELELYFRDNSSNKEEATQFIEDFEKFWINPEFTPNYKDLVYITCNKMLVKKLKPYPYFKDYLITVVNHIDHIRDFKSFTAWQKCVEKSLNEKSNSTFTALINTSLNLFQNNVFFKSPSCEWSTLEGVYRFEYDSTNKIIFPPFTLKCKNNIDDSLVIENIAGVYYPSSGKFMGKGGIETWERTGLAKNVYAELKRVNIDCKTAGFKSDSVIFHHPKYFEKPQLGVLNDKLKIENISETYPRFDSYTKKVLIKNVLKDVDFEGGFSMRGPKFVGSGSSIDQAKIIFYRNNKAFLQLSAKSFLMNDEKITSENASVKFILNKDSIIHPGLIFKYFADKRKVTLIRTDDGLQKTPFYDSYHKVDMYFEELDWKIDSAKINLGFLAGNLQGQAFFESENFFTNERYQKLTAGDVNPINKINEYSISNNNIKSFTAVDLAKFMKWLAIDLRPILFKLVQFGLIDFNLETDVITIREKLSNYLGASRKKLDYDIITIHSIFPGKTNASLNLLNDNFDLNIKGVKQVMLSDTQKVFIFPYNKEVVLKKGRDISFSGTVVAGKFEFHGKEFDFSYDKNLIYLNNVDSARIFVDSKEPDINGNYGYRKVQTVLEKITGELLIDGITNHSGNKLAPRFPIFKSFKESYAFYDKKSIQRGAYKKDNFYFKLDPFTIDSIDNIKNESIIFDGEFSSAGIFPTFREKLTLQEDYSLGFKRKTPPGGFELYGGKAKFENEIKLSNKGLRANGDINFGPSTSSSDDFVFYPDSLNGLAQKFNIKETTDPNEFPQASGENVYIHWMPYKDVMEATDKKDPFIAYNSQAKFHGTMRLSTTDLFGKGKVDFEKADLISKRIHFKRRKFLSDTADFHLRAIDEEGLTFSTENLNSTIDFDLRTGIFKSNGKASIVRFDKNQYIAYLDRFKWYMDSENIQIGDDQKKIDYSHDKALDLEGPEFISVHPDQDSLRFFSPAANYNLRKYIINCLNVPFINVADARFFPDSGKVTIFRKAVLDTLRNAKMLANTVTRFHELVNVKGNIFGRKSFLASGDYSYLDENEQPHVFKFQKINPDTAGITVSEGKISEESNFKLNPYFSFAGLVKLYAPNQFLVFEGGTKIVHGCNKVGKSYLKFKGEINPREIFIPVQGELVDVENNPVGSGLLYSLDSSKVYSSFISPVKGKKDKNIISANGYIFYNKEENSYQISSKEKLQENSLPGNFLTLNTSNCSVYAEGKLDLGAELGQVKTNTVGQLSNYTINDSTILKLMMTVDFFIEEKAMKKMYQDMEPYLGSATTIDFSKPEFEKGLRELMGKEKGDKAISDLNLNGGFRRFPDELEKTFFLSDVIMKFDKESKSFLSTGKIGVGNVYKNEFNRYVDGVIQLKKQKSGDMLTIYIELDQSNWYYFSYFKGVMSCVSSNKEFNTILSEVKPKSRKMEVDKGPSYQYNVCGANKKDAFLKKIKRSEEANSDE
jgi:hypothetical protein